MPKSSVSKSTVSDFIMDCQSDLLEGAELVRELQAVYKRLIVKCHDKQSELSGIRAPGGRFNENLTWERLN